jgi:hypothetical protein
MLARCLKARSVARVPEREVRRLDGLSTIQPALLLTPLPKRFPDAPGPLSANYGGPTNLRAFLIPGPICAGVSAHQWEDVRHLPWQDRG